MLAEGRRRAGGDAGGAQAESVVGDVGEAVVGVVGDTWASGPVCVREVWCGVAHTAVAAC